MNRRFSILAAVILLASLGVGWGVGQYRKARSTSAADAGGSDHGAVQYQAFCASCHGPDGKGDGAAGLRPPPRSFASRPWRGTVTAETIRKVAAEGIPGTAMPANRTLPAADLDALAEHVLRLAAQPEEPSARDADGDLLNAAGFLDLRGTTAPKLEAIDAAGRTVSLADAKGKLLLVHFWGVNCPHCEKELPKWKMLEEEYANRGLAILHVCLDADTLAEAQASADRHAAGLRILDDNTGLAAARFGVQTLPTVWLFDSMGQPLARVSGARDWASSPVRQVLEHWLP